MGELGRADAAPKPPAALMAASVVSGEACLAWAVGRANGHRMPLGDAYVHVPVSLHAADGCMSCITCSSRVSAFSSNVWWLLDGTRRSFRLVWKRVRQQVLDEDSESDAEFRNQPDPTTGVFVCGGGGVVFVVPSPNAARHGALSITHGVGRLYAHTPHTLIPAAALGIRV